MVPARTYLYVPGDRPDRFAKAAGSGTDAVLLDLEDGVAPEGKVTAHAAVGEVTREPGPQWWVRVDPAQLEQGVRAAAKPGTTGVVLPGADPDALRTLTELLGSVEAERGLPTLAVLPLLETARGVAAVESVALAPRVHRLGLGEADLAAALGMVPSQDRRELWPIRSAVVVASALAGISPPVGPVQTDLSDEDLLRTSTVDLVRQGFSARTLIHPSQIEVVHASLRPTDEQVSDAEDVARRFHQAAGEGRGVAVDARGRLIDLAVLRSAEAVLRRAGRP